MAEKPYLPLLANKHQLVAAGSIAVALAVMGIKYVAFLMTGSVALFSDALESIVNLLTAIAALIAIRVGSHPPDRNHPFGPHKAEYFSAVLEGVLGRRFPLYGTGDTNAKPGGRMRQLQYKLVAGEATWYLKLDRVVEFKSGTRP